MCRQRSCRTDSDVNTMQNYNFTLYHVCKNSAISLVSSKKFILSVPMQANNCSNLMFVPIILNTVLSTASAPSRLNLFSNCSWMWYRHRFNVQLWKESDGSYLDVKWNLKFDSWIHVLFRGWRLCKSYSCLAQDNLHVKFYSQAQRRMSFQFERKTWDWCQAVDNDIQQV